MLGQKIDIALIQPPGWSKHNPPLGLALLKSYLALKGINAKVFDLNIILYNLRCGVYSDAWELSNGYYIWEKESYVKQMFAFYSYEILSFIDAIFSFQPRVIGLSVHSSSFVSAKLLASKIKQISPHTNVIFGGPEVADYTDSWKTLLSEGNVDAVIFGEGEESLAEFMKVDILHCDSPIEGIAYRNSKGQIIKGPSRRPIIPLDSIPFADFSDFNLKSYFDANVLPTYFSRGCINSCIYCTENKFFPKFRNRSGQRVFEEILHQLSVYPGTKYFRMHDSISNGNIKELEKFCNLLIDNKIKIGFNLENAVIRKEMDTALYIKLKKAGCNIIGYGLENPSKPLLRSVGKLVCSDTDFDKVISEGARAKITICINMMFGLPGESYDDYRSQRAFIKKHRRHKKYILINPALNCCYFPAGSDVYMDPDKYGIDMSKGGLYWSEKSGRNTFPERLDKFEQFCSLANRLGYRNIFEVNQSVNRHELLGNYYYNMGEYRKCLFHFMKSFECEIKTSEIIDNILKIYDKLFIPRDSAYEDLAKCRLINEKKCDSWTNSPVTQEKLTEFMASIPLVDSVNRINSLVEHALLPRPEFSFVYLKQLARYGSLKIFGRIEEKKHSIVEQLFKIRIDSR